MGINNPDILLPLLDELIEKFQKWNYIASDIVTESDRLQNIASNLITQERQKVTIFKNQVEDDTNSIRYVKNEIDLLQSKCEIELQETQRLKSETQIILSESKSTLAYWKNELSKALAWLDRANERLRVAEINYENTKIQVKNAQELLRQAKKALEKCRNSESIDKGRDKVPPNCTDEESWVRDAEKQLRITLQNLRNAELKLTEAKNEVQKAKVCVNLCHSAVELATMAVTLSSKADSYAGESNIYAEKSKEEWYAAKNFQIQAESKLSEENEMLDNSLALLEKASNNYDESYQNNKRANALTDSAQNYFSNGVQDLEIRLDFLRGFALPISPNVPLSKIHSINQSETKKESGSKEKVLIREILNERIEPNSVKKEIDKFGEPILIYDFRSHKCQIHAHSKDEFLEQIGETHIKFDDNTKQNIYVNNNILTLLRHYTLNHKIIDLEMSNSAEFKEKRLVKFVNRELNSGKTKITIPASLFIDVKDETLLEVKRLCKLNGASVNIDV